MSNFDKRIRLLEARLKPAGAWWERIPYLERVNAWQISQKEGRYIDFNTGRCIAFEELATIDPVRHSRITEVLNDEHATETD